MEEFNSDLFVPRKRRAALKSSLKDLSDSEDESHAKRSRKDSSDDEYCQPISESSKRPQTRTRPTSKTTSIRPKITKKQANSCLKKKDTKPTQSRNVGKKIINQSNASYDSSGEEQGKKDTIEPSERPHSKISKENNSKQPYQANCSQKVNNEEEVQEFQHVTLISTLTSRKFVTCFYYFNHEFSVSNSKSVIHIFCRP